jgi:hypothetical protein
VGRQSAEDDVVRETKFEHLVCFVRPEAIVDKYSRVLISELLCFRVEDQLEPL